MDTWDLMQHWNLVLPPSRPSAVQLARITLQIHQVDRSAPVAILGSTPEFRDLLHECGFQRIYVFERNETFYDAMSELRIYRNSECFIKGDWLETLSGYTGMFSLILSDLTSGNVPYSTRARFYSLITEALSESGIFCDKVLTHVGPNLSVDELIRKYSVLPLNLLYINHFSCEMLFCSALLDLEQLVNTSLFYSTLNEYVKHERVRAFVRYAQKITPPSFLWYYGHKWEQLESEYCPNLELVAVDNDERSSPYYGRLKFFMHMKK